MVLLSIPPDQRAFLSGPFLSEQEEDRAFPQAVNSLRLRYLGESLNQRVISDRPVSAIIGAYFAAWVNQDLATQTWHLNLYNFLYNKGS